MPLPMGADPETRSALGTAEQTPGQRHGRCLMDAEPVALLELHPAAARIEGRVHLVYFHSLPDPKGQEAGPDTGAAETGKQPALLARLPQVDSLPPEVQLLHDNRFDRRAGVVHNARHVYHISASAW